MSANVEMFAAWLGNPKNANHPDRAAIQAEHDRMSGTTGRTPAASAEDQLAAEILATAAPLLAQRPPEAKKATVSIDPDPEAAMAASILAVAGITPRSAQATHSATFGASGTDQARQPVTASAAQLEAAAIRGFLASPESVSLSDASRRQYEQRLAELEG